MDVTPIIYDKEEYIETVCPISNSVFYCCINESILEGFWQQSEPQDGALWVSAYCPQWESHRANGCDHSWGLGRCADREVLRY